MEKLKLIYNNYIAKINQNQQSVKKVYFYSIGILILTAILQISLSYFFPNEAPKFNIPVSYKYSTITQKQAENEYAMGKIVGELQNFKTKREHSVLNHEDSLRIEFLINQYNKIKKNGY